MKRLFIATAFAAAAVFGFANGQDEASTDSGVFGGDDVTLRFVMDGTVEQQAWMDELLADFNAEYPNIGVEVIWTPVGAEGWGGYFTKIKTMIASGQSPDLAMVASEGFQLLHEGKLAVPLNDYVEAHPELVDEYEDIHTKLQNACIIDGNLYGFAWNWNNVVTHINLDMLEAANLPFPSANWNKEEFLRYAQAMTIEKDGKKQYGTFIPNYNFMITGWLYNFGASVLNDEMSAAALETPEMQECMQFMHDLIYKYGVSPAPIPGDNFISMMTNRQVAMTFGGRWPVPAFVNADLNFDIQYVPSFNTNQVVYGTSMFPVMTASKHPEEAFIFSAWLSGRRSQEVYLSSFSIPTRLSVMDKVLPANPPENAQLFKTSADSARVVQAPAQFPEVEAAFMRAFNTIMSDPNADISGILSASNSDINEILSR
ncbi:MAG: sugar ABC transporter substrate-binding protein [Spirochaetales bacterium]|nr:sugar ABC transporter substrate-binding protein [Spirochaetales bacterium]